MHSCLNSMFLGFFQDQLSCSEGRYDINDSEPVSTPFVYDHIQTCPLAPLMTSTLMRKAMAVPSYCRYIGSLCILIFIPEEQSYLKHYKSTFVPDCESLNLLFLRTSHLTFLLSTNLTTFLSLTSNSYSIKPSHYNS